MPCATLADLARLVGGRVVGAGALPISGAATLDSARPGDISLAENARLAPRLARSQASAVVVPPDFPPPGIPCLVVNEVRSAFTAIVEHFRPPRTARRTGISPAAQVSPTARLAEDVEVHAGAVIGDEVQLGRGSTIHAHVTILAGSRLEEEVVVFPHATIYEDTVIGARSVIHAGAVLGAYGFGYETSQGRHRRGPQLGFVQLGADVEVGANSTIDRGTYGPTVIGEGTKIDNLVMIAHNCRIGRHNIICSQVGIAGSSTTGDYVVMAGQVGVPDHVHIGDRAVLGAKAGIMRDVPDGMTYLGIPATPEREQLLVQAALARLPEMRKQLKALERRVETLLRDNRSPRPDAA